MSRDHQKGLRGGRLFVLAWVGVYPMVTLISWLFGEVLQALPLLVRTFILSGLVVGYMVFFWIPLIGRVMNSRQTKREHL
jgi:antibiotic biosynthesis monooxygenase (ABM) superfamily enzyme